MKIAVFGSWRKSDIEYWNLRYSKDLFEKACYDLGVSIAQNGHSVIVGSQSSNTADLHIVKGIIEGTKNKILSRPLVEIFRPKDKHLNYEELTKKFPHIFAFSQKSQPNWGTTHLFAVREADAVIVIGGAMSSYSAGLAAIINRKRLVPIGSFGGAGDKLLGILENMPDVENVDDFRRLYGPWTDFLLQSTLNLLRIYDYPKILIIHGRSKDWVDLKNYLQNIIVIPEPVVMGQKYGEGKTLPEKFEYLASHVDGAIILATPDDVGALILDDREQSIPKENRISNLRARQNIWLEVGWFWGALGRNRIMILCRGDIEIPSDVKGMEIYYYDKHPSDRGEKIRSFIEKLKGA